MLSNFDRKILAALNSIRISNESDYGIVIQGLKDQEQDLSKRERTCKDEITLRWTQGARQALADLVHQLENTHQVLLTMHDRDEERKRDAGVRGRAIG